MPFSLYVHIPYCLSKCPYCDFNAYAAQSWPEARYTDALCKEFACYMQAPPWQDETLETIYFGGGTPSLFQPASLERFLTCVAKHCRLAPDVEITLEADPATVSLDTLSGYRALGISRLSLGIQSFESSVLRTLGRLHTREEALRSIEIARAAKFFNLNIDLIFGVPNQTLDLLTRDLNQVFGCEPEHISMYGLTYEENTPFYAMRQKGVLQPVDEETEVAMYTQVQSVCAAHGYERYEISNFARPGYASQHNLRYWQGGAYLGLGAGAHSFSCTPGWGVRWSNIRNPKAYMEQALATGRADQYVEHLAEEQARGEFLFLNLRQMDGMPLSEFARRFGRPFFEQFPHAADMVSEKLMTQSAGKVRLTPKGLLVADSVFMSFF